MSLLRRWICTSSTKNMLVKIVHRGGHVELHDRPLLASEVMSRNPKCVVAHPHVFKEPCTAVVKPDTMLLLGYKYYVVPSSTVRKLQRRSFKNNNNSNSSSNPESNGNSSGHGSKEARAREEESEKKRVKCFVCLIQVGDKLGNIELSFCGSEKKKKKKKKKGKEHNGGGETPEGSPNGKGLSALEYFQPRLGSIHEEASV